MTEPDKDEKDPRMSGFWPTPFMGGDDGALVILLPKWVGRLGAWVAEKQRDRTTNGYWK